MKTEVLDHEYSKNTERKYLSQNCTSVDETIDSKFRYGDLYLIGIIWLCALKSALLGAKISIIPTVQAASAKEPPKRPPPMKFKDLPIYKSPHYEYNEFIENKSKCPDANVKLMHRFLLPYVTQCRKGIQDIKCQVTCTLRETLDNIRTALNESKNVFKTAMRDPENIVLRKAVVGIGAATGYVLAAGKGIPRRIFMTAAGAAAGGALCFPKETDEAFRNFAYYTGKTTLGIYNWTCGKEFTLRERLPCQDDLPATTNKVISQCPHKK